MAWRAGDSGDISSLLVLLVVESVTVVNIEPLCVMQRGFFWAVRPLLLCGKGAGRFELDILAGFGYIASFCRDS